MMETQSTKYTLKVTFNVSIFYEGNFHLEDMECKKDRRHCVLI